MNKERFKERFSHGIDYMNANGIDSLCAMQAVKESGLCPEGSVVKHSISLQLLGAAKWPLLEHAFVDAAWQLFSSFHPTHSRRPDLEARLGLVDGIVCRCA